MKNIYSEFLFYNMTISNMRQRKAQLANQLQAIEATKQQNIKDRKVPTLSVELINKKKDWEKESKAIEHDLAILIPEYEDVGSELFGSLEKKLGVKFKALKKQK